MIIGAVSALGATIVALVIPVVMRLLVDGPLANNDPSEVWPFGLLILGLGLAEAGCILLRRFMVTQPSTAIEATMRNSLYAKLQRLPVAFHDRWQSGQLLSRAVQDLGRLRRFLAFGAIMFLVNMLTIVIGIGVLLYWSPLLGAVFVLVNAPILWITFKFERKYWGAARLSLDQTGDLATTVEQSVHGIRVLKAFGRGPHALEGFTKQATNLRHTEIRKAQLDATLWAWLTFIPLTSYAVCLFLGVWLVSIDALTVGQLAAFFATAVVLTFPIESIGFLYAFAIEAANASVRFREVMDGVETIRDPEEPKTIEHPRGRLEFRDV
ncbi:MAG TPA: ABC transporter ATP-binding protein, partial [Candidatus Agrococcus pullicola]|nr:ABC transporter ATP-binding protein [Candidatus Agrococcus pullicola]